MRACAHIIINRMVIQALSAGLWATEQTALPCGVHGVAVLS
jgi:hypothetical protein